MSTQCLTIICFAVVMCCSSCLGQTENATSTTTIPDITRGPSLRCDFESGNTCLWTEPDGDTMLRWVVVNGSQVDGLRDHTTDAVSGHSLTTKGYDHVKGKATLKSNLDLYKATCLVFFLRLPVKGTVSFAVYNSMGNLRVPVYRSRSAAFPDWHRFEINFFSQRSYKIEMESEQESGEEGQIFLDNLMVLRGRCPVAPLSYTNVTCNFEDGSRMCGYTADTNSTNDWSVSRATRRPSKFMRKMFDHTLGTSYGHSLMSHSYDTVSDNMTARVRSPWYSGSGYHCMSFYYEITGLDGKPPISNDEELRVYIVPRSADPSDLSPWQRGTWRHSTGGNRWTEATLAYAMDSQYQVVFESISTSPQTAYIIDDITITECPAPPTTPTTTTTTPIPSNTTTPALAPGTVKTQEQVANTKSTVAIATGSGVGLLVLVIVVAVFLVKRRQQQAPQQRNGFDDLDSPDMSIAFNNPMFPEQKAEGPVMPNIKQSGEANA